MATKEKPKFSGEDYRKAVEVIDYFRDRYELELNHIQRKKGIKYIKCEHLKNGTQTFEQAAQWGGDNLRFVLCPICTAVRWGDLIRRVMHGYNGIKEDEPPTEQDKKPLPANFTGRIKVKLARVGLLWTSTNLLRSMWKATWL